MKTYFEPVKRTGLVVDGDKIKNIICHQTSSHCIRDSAPMALFGSHNFEVANNFVCLVTSLEIQEIQHRATLGNRCYFELSRQLESKILSLLRSVDLESLP